jgi:hypothetical protein
MDERSFDFVVVEAVGWQHCCSVVGGRAVHGRARRSGWRSAAGGVDAGCPSGAAAHPETDTYTADPGGAGLGLAEGRDDAAGCSVVVRE